MGYLRCQHHTLYKIQKLLRNHPKTPKTVPRTALKTTKNRSKDAPNTSGRSKDSAGGFVAEDSFALEAPADPFLQDTAPPVSGGNGWGRGSGGMEGWIKNHKFFVVYVGFYGVQVGDKWDFLEFFSVFSFLWVLLVSGWCQSHGVLLSGFCWTKSNQSWVTFLGIV